METNISAITEASDKYFHRTRVAVHSFIKHNQWFDGTLYLLTISSLPISQKNINALCQIYQNIQIVNLSSLTEVSTIEAKFKQKNRDTEQLCKYLKLFITQLNIPNLLYFSNSSLFLGSVSEIILNSNTYITNTDFSIFYINTLDITLDSEIQEKIIKSESVETLFDPIVKYNFSTINTDSYDCATSFNDTVFSKKKSQLSRLKYINYNTFYSKFANCSKINQVWLQLNYEIQKILNRPSSIKKEVKITRPISKKIASSPNSLINQTDSLKSKKIAICTICNDEFSIGAQTMIYSFLENNNWFTGDIIIFHNSDYSKLSLENIELLSRLYKNIIFKEVKTSDYSSLIDKFNKSNNSKRFIPSLFTFEAFELAAEYDRTLYLDSDMVILKNISELFSISTEISVTPDSGKYDLRKKYNTFNGGFLLIDSVTYPKQYKKKLLDFSLTCTDMRLADQSIMNDFFKNKVHYLDSRYNCLKRCFPDNNFKSFDKNIKIVHYVGAKPWVNKESRPPHENNYTSIEQLWKNYNSNIPKLEKNIIFESIKIAVVVHIYYQELWPEIKLNLSKITSNYDLYVTLSSDHIDSISDDILDFKSNTTILFVPNKGADVGPFFTVLNFCMSLNKKYDWVLKIHGKKSLLTGHSHGETWRKLNYSTLIPSNFNKIFNELTVPSVGMVGLSKYLMSMSSRDLVLKNNYNKENMEYFINRLKLKDSQLLFFAGTMFWIKYSILENTFKNNKITIDDFEEGHSKDGTKAHAMERIFANIVRHSNYKLLGI